MEKGSHRGTVKRERIIGIIQKRLGFEDSEFQAIEKNPRFQRLFDNALAASQYRLVAEVIESRGCHSGHTPGQKLFFDSSGNLLTREAPERVCAFLLPNLLLLVNAFFENLMNGRDPNEVIFNRTGCFDVGPACGGWGRVVLEMKAVKTDIKGVVPG
ncbi:MAG: hypothetical protein WAL98_06320 [Desulfatiglandaceae bacterium]|jgi:hypothetical protein